MINFAFAEENLHKYKFDYSGYLVIVDKIRTMEVLNSYDYATMKNHLQDLKEKYKKELLFIQQIEPKNEDSNEKKIKSNKSSVVNELKYILKCLPVIGFMILGKGKDIGVDYHIASSSIITSI